MNVFIYKIKSYKTRDDGDECRYDPQENILIGCLSTSDYPQNTNGRGKLIDDIYSLDSSKTVLVDEEKHNISREELVCNWVTSRHSLVSAVMLCEFVPLAISGRDCKLYFLEKEEK